MLKDVEQLEGERFELEQEQAAIKYSRAQHESPLLSPDPMNQSEFRNENSVNLNTSSVAIPDDESVRMKAIPAKLSDGTVVEKAVLAHIVTPVHDKRRIVNAKAAAVRNLYLLGFNADNVEASDEGEQLSESQIFFNSDEPIAFAADDTAILARYRSGRVAWPAVYHKLMLHKKGSAKPIMKHKFSYCCREKATGKPLMSQPFFFEHKKAKEYFVKISDESLLENVLLLTTRESLTDYGIFYTMATGKSIETMIKAAIDRLAAIQT
ncbi:hypothetical protein TKK_0002591 [Trichogramma kaykai]